MFEVEIGGNKVEAEVSFYTAQLYEAEFQSDIIQDLFGKQSMDDGEFEFSDGVLVQIDFTKVDWLAVTKATWAAVKTADPMADSYTNWMRKVKGVNLWDLRTKLVEEVSECFFRADPAEEGDEEGDHAGHDEAVHEDGD